MSASINVPRTSGEDVSASSSSSLGGGSSGSTATTTTCEDVSSTTTHSSPTTASTTGGTTAASASSTSTSSSVVVRSASGTRTRLLTRSPCAPRPVSSQNSALVAFFERRLAQIRALTVDPIVNAYTIWTENAEFVRMCKYAATTLGTVTLVLLLRRQYLLTQRRRLDALNNRDERKDNEKRPRQQRGASTGPGRPNTLRGGILVVGRDKAYEDVSIMLKKPSSSRTTTSGVPRTKRNKMQTALPEESPEDLLDEDDVLSVASTNRTAPGGGPRSGGGSAFGGKPRVSAAQDEVRETLLGTTVAEKNDEDEGTTTPSEASEQVVEETRPAARNVHSVAMVASDVSGLLAGAWTSIASSISSTAHAVKNTRATSRSSPSAADIKNKVDADSSSKRGCEESSSKTESSSSTILPIMRPKAAVSRCRSREGDPGVVQKIGLFCVQQLANAGLLVPKNVSLAAKEYVASRSAPYSLEDTIIVMKELARAFHFRCREFCEMSNSVRERLFMKRMCFARTNYETSCFIRVAHCKNCRRLNERSWRSTI
ncbi:unnamed protein product [Amoebophrya sp. A25]|nr:unnamed protein product [Amoebophrya sp. A25]|eukprot:GSA25T00019215001.1